MDEKTADSAGLVQDFKPQLLDAIRGDPDFLLQYCHSSRLLTQKEYDHVKACTDPWEKARDILDYMMSKDIKSIQRFLSLLKEKEIQEEFPKLGFLNTLPRREVSTTGKKRKQSELEDEKKDDNIPTEKLRKLKQRSSRVVTEKQLMMVARHIGANWKEVGRVVLEISSVSLEQIVAENPGNHREQVFGMLHLWSNRERDEATPTRLHSLLTQEENAVKRGSIDFLLEDS